jgi:DNA uptake protein ComE-like DNA-binding protein
LDTLKAYGFKPESIRHLDNFRKKGWRLKWKQDLRRIAGIDSVFFHDIERYIVLPEKAIVGSTKPSSFQTKHGIKKDQKLFDLNKADTAQLKEIKGIGDKLSARIVKYREALGGFINSTQVAEVYGLDTLVVAKIRKASFIASDFQPRKLDVNNSDANAFSTHPYLSRPVAKSIVAYRFQHGKFKSIEDLHKIRLLDSVVLKKIEPYLVLGE